jgi:hypothetical protein
MNGADFRPKAEKPGFAFREVLAHRDPARRIDDEARPGVVI